ncbi:MAG TPA: FtsX-like permease family protein [Kofleriaceae bacterium]|nr:FtsX-like permease family protein [Kofleriaceae bacterium]
MVPVQYNVRSLFVRKVTTTVTAVGIGLVVFVFAGALMIREAFEHALGATGRPDVAVVIRKGSDNELSSAVANAELDRLKGHTGVASVIGEVVVVIAGERADGSGAVSNVLVRGTPADGFKFRPELKIVEGRLPNPGGSEVIVGKAIAGRFKGLSIGGTFDLRHNRPLTVVGVFEADGASYESEVWGDVDYIRHALGREAGVSSVRVHFNSPSDFDSYRSEIETDKTMAMKVAREADYLRKQGESTASFLSGMGIAFAIMFSLAAMLGAAITMNGAVANRSREIGTLRALGFSRFSILTSFVLEALVLAIIGGILGSICVLALTFVKVPVMNFQTFSEIVIQFHAAPSVFVKALVFSGVMGLIGGLIPAIRASQVSPVEAMRA